MERKVYFNNNIDENLVQVSDSILSTFLKENYDFSAAVMLNDYDSIFLLLEEDQNNSFNDKWKILFYKEVLDIKNQVLTLDNLNDFKSGSNKRIEVYKEYDGSFKDVIETVIQLVKRHKKE